MSCLFLLKVYAEIADCASIGSSEQEHILFNRILHVVPAFFFFLRESDFILLLRGNFTHNQKLACFVLYLKIINTILKNNMCIL